MKKIINIDLKDKNVQLFFIILLVGLSLRIYRLTTESLWLDEGFSIGAARDIFKLMQSPTVSDFINNYVDKNPPLYFIFLNFWMKIFGDSEFAVRFPSVIFGMLSIIMTYQLGKMLFNKGTGLFASFFMSITFIQIYYSQETRYYNLYILLAILSFYFLEKVIENKDLKYSAGYVIFTGMLLYTHVHSVFIIMAQNAYFIILFLFSGEFRQKFNYLKWIVLQMILAAIYLPWIRVLLVQISDMQKGGWLSPPNHYKLIHTSYIFTGSFLIVFLFILLIPLAIMKFSKIKGEFRWSNPFESLEGFSLNVDIVNTRQFLLLSLWFLIPIFVPYLYSRIKMPIYHFRYVLAASVPIYILAAAGFSRLKSAGLKTVIVTLITAISLFNLFGYSDLVKESAREKWREASATVETQAKPGDLVIVSAGYCLDYIFNYYSRRTDIVKKPFPQYSASPRASRDIILINEGDIAELKEIIKGHRRIWLVLSHTFDANSLMAKEIAKTHKVMFRLSFVNDPNNAEGLVIVVYLFEQMQE